MNAEKSDRRHIITITHLYTGPDNRSHFAERGIALDVDELSLASSVTINSAAMLRSVPEGCETDIHNAQHRQLAICLQGVYEIECSDGTARQFGPGDIILADDTTGEGHRTHNIGGSRLVLLLPCEDLIVI
jgi:quercetin dioxygenase-like cupin family protein